MRKIHGQWQANYSDTFDLDTILSPIILAGLIKFRDVLVERHKEDKTIGIPSRVVSYDADDDINVQTWFDILDLMIYAFDPTNEPDIDDYGVEFTISPDNGVTWYKIEDQTKWDRYMTASKAYEKKKMRGLKLFAEYYHDLWW